MFFVLFHLKTLLASRTLYPIPVAAHCRSETSRLVVAYVCGVLSGSGLCDDLITRSEETYRV